MSDIKISVIITIYNSEKYLEECIESIINQTYKNLQIILVDNGSSDKSGEICEAYSKKDERIVVIHKEHGGISSGRNKGLEIADGEYVSFVDSDDVVLNDMYETLLDSILIKDSDIAICKAKRMYQDLIEETEETGEVNNYDSQQALYQWICKKLFGSEVWGKLYKRTLVKDIRFPEIKCEDVCYLFDSIIRSKNILVVDKKKYLYRMHRLYKERSAYRRPVEDEKVFVLENILVVIYKEYHDIYIEMFASVVESILSSVLRIYAAKKIKSQKIYLNNAKQFFLRRKIEIKNNEKISKKMKRRIKLFAKYNTLFKFAFFIRNLIRRV